MYERIRDLVAALSTDLYERDEAVRLCVLATMAGESVFLLGPPGVGKSLLARRLQQAFRDAKSFSYLMGRFSTPDEVFGPLSLQRLKQDDRYERVTTNYLPDADIVFLDEIWKASPPIQNALLTALNERLYRNGTQEISIPLKVFIGASNELPEDEGGVEAFWDRFLVRLVLEPVKEIESMTGLLDETGDVYRDVVDPKLRFTSEEYAAFAGSLQRIELPHNVLDLLLAIRNRLSSGGESDPIYVSDRRWKRIAHLLRASAGLHGRDSVTLLDCAIVRHCAWHTAGDRQRVEQVVQEELALHAGLGSEVGLLRNELGNVEGRLRELTTTTETVTAQTPVQYREEYCRLLAASGADTLGSEEGDLRLVWHGDIDGLQVGSSDMIDLYRYGDDDQFLGSESVEMNRTADWTLQIGERLYTVETTEDTATSVSPRTLSAKERKELSGSIGEVLSLADERSKSLLLTRQVLLDEAQAHLFVDHRYAEIVAEALVETAKEIADVQIEAGSLAKRIEQAG